MEKQKGPGVTIDKQGKKRRNGGSLLKEVPHDEGTKCLKEDCILSESFEVDKKSSDTSEVEEESGGIRECSFSPMKDEDIGDRPSLETSSGNKFRGKKLNILKPKGARAGAKEPEKKSGEEDKKMNPNAKYVLFLGNLSYDVTQEAVEEHFKVVKGAIQDVRLLNDKETGRPRGCGFIQLDSKKAYEKARKLHKSLMDGRKIRVEYTTPGSGKSQKRKKFMAQKSKKLLRQKAKNKKKRHLKGIRT